jgi:tape measure domain-containing protein
VAENLVFNLDVDNSKAVEAVNNFFESFDKGSLQAKSKLNAAFNQKLETQVKVEFKNGKLVTKEIQKIRQESNRLGEIHKAVNGELGKTPNQLKKQSQILKALLGDTQKFKNGTKQVTEEFKTLTARIKKVGKEMEKVGQSSGVIDKIGARFALIQTAANLATTGVLKIVQGIGQFAASAVEMETLTLQLEGFTGGAKQADAAFAQFIEIAAASPFDLKQVANAAKIMMAFGMSTEEAVQATEQLAVVSAATGGDINLLGRNMGQIVAQGRAYTRDLTQFAIQGVPIWDSLADVTGKSVVALKEMAAEGKITGTEVTAALKSMTAEGTSFREIADRMQETFAGRLAKIAASFQALAKEIIDAFNEIDDSMGGALSEPMEAFSELIFDLSDGIKKMAKDITDNMVVIKGAIEGAALALGGLITATGIYYGLQNAGAILAIVKALGGIRHVMKLITMQTWFAVKAKAALLGLSGPKGWAILAVGVGAAAGAMAALKAKTDEETAAAKELEGSVDGVKEGFEEANEAASQGGMKEALKASRDAAQGAKEALDQGVETLKSQKEAIKERYEKERTEIQSTREKVKERMDGEKAAYDTAVANVNARYDAEDSRLNSILAKVRERYDLEIGQLSQRGPAEQQLYNFQKQQLAQKISSGKLDNEALLSARARLERMNRQEQIERLRIEKKKEESVIMDRQKRLEKDREDILTRTKKMHEDMMAKLQEDYDSLSKKLKRNKKEQAEVVDEIDNAMKGAKRLGVTVDITNSAVSTQISLVNNLADSYATAAEQAERLARAAQNASALEGDGTQAFNNALNSRFAGGPVSGGSSYTVNELGKEAFLSASGRLSMINAPSYGKWKAPSSGTVIPAHMTRRLNVPSGGVNLNKVSSTPSGGTSTNRLISALLGAVGGDTVTNNVTIESANTTQAASDIMVQLAKLKRLRYN